MDNLYGTPQGFTLGPLIWNTFFDPLLVEISALASSHLTPTEELDLAFADDLTLIAASEDLQVVEQCLEEKLEVFSNFLKERGMKAAAHKMRTMTLDPFFKNFTPRVTFRGTPIQVVETHVFLGIILDNHMTFVPHWKMMCKSMEGRIQTIKALRSASWGATQQTAKVLHHSYIEGRISYGILSWYPFLDSRLRRELEKITLKSMRVVIGLPQQTKNIALKAEADLNTVLEIAQRTAVSYYTRLNPEDTSQHTNSLAHRLHRQRRPIWTTLLEAHKPKTTNNRWRTQEEEPEEELEKAEWKTAKTNPVNPDIPPPLGCWKGEGFKGIPETIWRGPIQVSLPNKKTYRLPRIYICQKTLKGQQEVEREEAKYSRVLYTDASVNIQGDPPGKAAVGYIWFEVEVVDPNPNTPSQSHLTPTTPIDQPTNRVSCREISRGSAHIGYNHSSYSAEAVAIQMGLRSEPPTKTTPGYPVGIFTDSLSNISTIHAGLASSEEQARLLEALEEYPGTITIHHVKAHGAIIRNNLVDELCNVSATPSQKTCREYLCSKKTGAAIKEWTRNYLSQRRLKTAAKYQKDSLTNAWIRENVRANPTTMLPRPTHYNHLPRRQGVLLAKARTYRWTSCNWFLHKISAITCDLCRKGNSWTNTCSACESCTLCGVSDDTRHVLDNCNLHEQARTKLLRANAYARNVSDLLANTNIQTTHKLVQFLIEADDTRIALREAKLAQINTQTTPKKTKKQKNKTKKDYLKIQHSPKGLFLTTCLGVSLRLE